MAIVLAGGLGTRLRRMLPHAPKVLAPVGGRPFLEWVLRYLRAQGVSNIVLSTGYLADQIDRFAQDFRLPGLEVRCVPEHRPLGTAGAVTHTLGQMPSIPDSVIVCNGDSLALGRLRCLSQSLIESTSEAILLGVRVGNAAPYGTLEVNSEGCLVRFLEKRPGAGLINAGIYLLKRHAIEKLPESTPLSFEHDVFPSWLARHASIQVMCSDWPFIDIGSEETMAQADEFVERHREYFQ